MTVLQDQNSQERFNAIMEYMCTGRYPEYKMINALCSIYGAENVVEKYDYAGGARQTNYKHKRKLKEYVALLTSGQIHFKSNGDYRIYSDNQIGYRNENPRLKSFLIDSEYDCFSDYEDGIYEISSAQYNDFYRGKNIQMNFTRDVHILYMLKKNGYYCFIHKGKKGLLAMLNGGALRRLDEKDICYYYNHMDEVVSYIRRPLDKYMSIMKKISEEIRKLGGSGTIHGCIVDIDWFDHIYVNPVDLTITGYWARNMIDKIVYPDVPALLKAECPEIYVNYLKLIGGDKDNPLVPVRRKDEVGVLPKEYLSTDIYKASREIKKMQKLTSNILSSWYENTTDAIKKGRFPQHNH